jgi:hypothetical protein
MAVKPTPEQGQLQLQIYDLRREAKLREARDWFQQNYRAETFEEAMKLMTPGTDSNAYTGMVIGYWEQACAYLNYGLLHEGLFFETNGEFFMIWEQLKKVLPEFREKFGDKHMLSNMEKAAQRYETWAEKRDPGSIEKMREYMKTESQPKAKSAKGSKS